MMKRFVTVVLRGLVSLSKEKPVWAKEHHRPPKKEMKRRRRAIRKNKSLGRRALVRAVGISWWSFIYWFVLFYCSFKFISDHFQRNPELALSVKVYSDLEKNVNVLMNMIFWLLLVSWSTFGLLNKLILIIYFCPDRLKKATEKRAVDFCLSCS